MTKQPETEEKNGMSHDQDKIEVKEDPKPTEPVRGRGLRKKGARLFTTISTLKYKLAAKRRSRSISPKEGPKVKRKISRKSRFQKGKTAKNGADNASPITINRDAISERSTFSDSGSDSESRSSSSSGRSWELESWKGRLSMSWQSLASVSSHLLVPGSQPFTSQISQGSDELSSASEVSGVSGGISMTGEDNSSGGSLKKSSVVIETVEACGITRHYLIPNSLVQSRRSRKQLKRKGTKLRICNDHVFETKRAKGSVDCSACRRRISSGLGRKSYVCRGCNAVCHKQCHTSLNSPCSNSSVATMEL